MDLNVVVSNKESHILCSVIGEIDLYNAKTLKDRVGEVMEDAGAVKNLILDLKDVKYIDSTGLGILIGIKRRISEGGGKLALVLTDQRITQLFTITGLNRIFDIAGSIEEAARKIA